MPHALRWRASIIAAIQAAHPSLSQTCLTRLEDGTYTDVWRWDSAEEMHAAFTAARNFPAVGATMSLTRDATAYPGASRPASRGSGRPGSPMVWIGRWNTAKLGPGAGRTRGGGTTPNEDAPMTARRFDTLGFTPVYACEVDPEFPGRGDWGCSHYGFHRDGPATEPFHSRWGAPLIVRLQAAGQDPWVGSFEAGGHSTLTGVFACPEPTGALVVCDGQAYLVDVTAPIRSTAIDLWPVIQVRRPGDLNLVVLATHIHLAAIGPVGLAWWSERLCLDGLRVLEATADGLRCAGDVAGGIEEFTVDPQDGQVRIGPRFLDTWPGH